jgi:hypothetical protein
MKIADFWDAMPRSPVDLLITLKKETESSFETSIAFLPDYVGLRHRRKQTLFSWEA